MGCPQVGWRPAMSGPVSTDVGGATLLWCKRSAADLLAKETKFNSSPYLARAAKAYAASGATGLMKQKGGNLMPTTRKPTESSRLASSNYMRPYGAATVPAIQMDMYSQVASSRASSRGSRTPLKTCAVGLIGQQSHADRYAGMTSGFEGAIAFAGFPQNWIRPGVN